LGPLHSSEINDVLIVYDNLASPATYGDYFYVVMLARYFTSQDISVNFVIVDGDYRDDWSPLNNAERKQVVSEYVKIANALLAPELSTIEVIESWELSARVGVAVDNDVLIPFRDEVLIRAPVYHYVINLLNRLCCKSSRIDLDRFLLSFEEFDWKGNLMRPVKPYITWACRYSTKWSFARNLSEEDFLVIYARLKVLYPGHEVMVVSDSAGCNHFKLIASQHDLKCIFSKDYSDTLLGDGALILGSVYFYTLWGNGMVVFPWFSKVSYEMLLNLNHETPWTLDMLFPWALKNQIWRFGSQREHHLPTLGLMHE
tara:strand:- start:509 stop:1450 length:942 start_codon:yes stop_codon:yes gene_type:complete